MSRPLHKRKYLRLSGGGSASTHPLPIIKGFGLKSFGSHKEGRYS